MVFIIIWILAILMFFLNYIYNYKYTECTFCWMNKTWISNFIFKSIYKQSNNKNRRNIASYGRNGKESDTLLSLTFNNFFSVGQINFWLKICNTYYVIYMNVYNMHIDLFVNIYYIHNVCVCSHWQNHLNAKPHFFFTAKKCFSFFFHD